MLNMDRPLALSVGIPLQMPMGEARTGIYPVKIEVYPRLKWAILTPLWLDGRGS
jgi:hypothetical protein